MKILDNLIKEYGKKEHKPYMSEAERELIKSFWAEGRAQQKRERDNMSDKYILMDLERTLKTGRCFYWNTGRRGYTNIIETAGRFSLEEASEIEAEDLDDNTIVLSVDHIEKTLGQLDR